MKKQIPFLSSPLTAAKYSCEQSAICQEDSTTHSNEKVSAVIGNLLLVDDGLPAI